MESWEDNEARAGRIGRVALPWGAAALVVGLQVADAATFLRVAGDYGLALEVNPLLGALAGTFGPAGAAAGKLLIVLLAVGVTLSAAAHGWEREARVCLLICGLIGALGALSNVRPYL
jgi:hypothetical protein